METSDKRDRKIHILFIPYYHLFLSRDLTIWAGSRRVDYPLTPPFPVSALINSIKHLSGIEKLNIIENDIVVRLKRDPKPCKYFSKQYMLYVKMLPLSIQSKWEKKVHMGGCY
jgi:hypothetical protein